MAEIIHWQQAVDQAETVRQAAACLERGELVAFPGGLAVSALAAESVARLGAEDRLILALPSADYALDWVPGMSALGQRLARRLWPGPVTLLFRDGWQDGMASQLEPAVRERLCVGAELGIMVPEQQALWYTLHMVASPILLAPLENPATLATLVIEDDQVEAPSVIRIQGEGWELVRAGAVAEADLQACNRRSIVFVCTGNTCRSPMAEALFRKLLAERLGCAAEELAARGYDIGSAGIAALPGEPAAAEAVDAVRELGGELAGHSSRPLTADLVRRADHLITMTLGHRLAIEGRFARPGQARTLCPDGQDIADPIGAGPEVYRDCAQRILDHLHHWLGELEGPCA